MCDESGDCISKYYNWTAYYDCIRIISATVLDEM